MPIEIKASTNDIKTKIADSIERIFGDDKTILNNVPIVIVDLENIPLLFPSMAIPSEYQVYKRFIKSGFGITKPKTFSGGEKKHLLVLSIENILLLDLTDEEFDAVIAHELGHIFNVPEFDIENFTRQTEFYADNFAKSINLKDALLGSIDKYLYQQSAENRDLFQLRIEKLNSDETFNGALKNL